MSQSSSSPRAGSTITYDPFVSPDREDPFPTLALAREDAPVFFSEGLGTWVVTRYDDLVAILRDPAAFSSAAAITNKPGPPPPEVIEALSAGIPYVPNSVDLDPPEHTKFRGLINKAFTPRRINGLEPDIRELCNALVDDFASSGTADLVGQFAYPLPTMVIGRLMGVPLDDMDDFKHWSDEWLILLGQLGGLERVVQAAHAVVEFQLYVHGMIEGRRQTPADDLVSVVTLAAAELDDPPSDAALVGLLMTVMFAGHETTTSLITNTVKQLARHPDQLEQVRADRALIPAAVVESLRFDPPVPAMYRTATREVDVAGVTLPAGTHIQLSFASANRDPSQFADPDRFDIHRDDAGRHLSFGKGIHYCVGAALAQLETRVGLDVLLDRLPGMDLAEGQVIVPTVSATVRGTERLDIVWST